jgi:hypothetical protein
VKHNLTLAALIVLLAALLTGAYLAANAEPSEPEEPGLFCFPQYQCLGGDCENGILDAYKLDVPDDLAICVVEFFYSGSSIPSARLGNGCDAGLCTFGMPFGPTLRAYSQPHDPSVIRIRVWTEPRVKRHAPVIMWNSYPYSVPEYQGGYP